MNKNFYRSFPLLAIMMFASSLFAQPGRRGNDGYDRRYDKASRHDNRKYDEGFGATRYDDYRVVRRRPHAQRHTQARRPSAMHVWIPGEWIFARGGYQYRSGYWMVPDRGRRFVEGYWQRTRRGWYWVPGQWVATRGRWKD